MKIKKLGALLVSAALCVGMAAPAFAFEGEAAPVEQPVLPEVVEEDVVTVTDETSGALTPEGNLTLVDDYHTSYSDGSGQQFITLVSKSGATFYRKLRDPVSGQPPGRKAQRSASGAAGTTVPEIQLCPPDGLPWAQPVGQRCDHAESGREDFGALCGQHRFQGTTGVSGYKAGTPFCSAKPQGEVRCPGVQSRRM